MAALRRWLTGLSLARKLRAIGVIATAASLALAGAVLLAVEISLERTRTARDIVTITDVVGMNSTGSVSFGDAKAADETLAAFRANSHVVTAAVLLADGRVLARYDRDRHPAALDKAVVNDLAEALDAAVHLVIAARRASHQVRRRAVGNGVRRSRCRGVLHARPAVSRDARRRALRRAGAVAVVVHAVAARHLRAAADAHRSDAHGHPRSRLSRARREGGRRRDRRADRQFNAMLVDIQKRDRQLLLQQEALERTVDARTAELRTSNHELIAARDRAMEAQPRQERVPGQHEPRDPHADERHHRHDRAGARHRADRRAARLASPRCKSSADIAADDPQRHPRLLEDRVAQARARSRSPFSPARADRRRAQAARAAGRTRRGSSCSATSRPTCPRGVDRRSRRGCSRC